MKLIFIDANVFLDLYRGKTTQLDVLENFPNLIIEKNYKIYLTDHLVNEVHRNRESVVKDQLNTFEKYKVNNNFSNIIRSLDIYEELKDAANLYNNVVEQGLNEIKDKIQGKALRADKLFKDIIDKSKLITTDEDDRRKARDRFDFGFPPGKDRSYGDALSWNVLLNHDSICERNLYLVTRDGDYLSNLDKKKPNTYLEDEWREKRHGEIKIFESIADLVSQLEKDEVEFKKLRRSELLDELKLSGSFAQTHSLIDELSPLIDDFNENDIRKFLFAYYSNSQVSMIGSDSDLKIAKGLIKKHPLYSKELRESIVREIIGEDED
ncbi:DUF4935 domain-containing protein [Acinetobacter sp. NIPH 2377]|uniref:PIN domain-containing protein n=1 Tax=Acinetobacter terrestris TaxID=2529843 RepID=UPI00148F7DB1|nr:PIN domain-containing protein [Acinetobacter terrestris]NNH36935.1 DUF4935 domain-containing protein [Acinetobacter terrestris]